MNVTGINVDKLRMVVPAEVIPSSNPDADVEMYMLHLVTDQGTSGVGEAGPYKLLSLAYYQDLLLELPRMPDLFPLPFTITSPQDFYLDYISQLESESLRAALDLAVHDAFAQENNVSIFKLYEEELAASGDVDEHDQPVEYIKKLLLQQNQSSKAEPENISANHPGRREAALKKLAALIEDKMITREPVLTYASSTDAFSVVESFLPLPILP